jgi:hypothetical protein
MDRAFPWIVQAMRSRHARKLSFERSTLASDRAKGSCFIIVHRRKYPVMPSSRDVDDAQQRAQQRVARAIACMLGAAISDFAARESDTSSCLLDPARGLAGSMIDERCSRMLGVAGRLTRPGL